MPQSTQPSAPMVLRAVRWWFQPGAPLGHTLNGVQELAWAITTTGTVHALPNPVMSWWFHPDRKDDLRDRIGLTHATDFDVTESTDDGGTQVRIARWRDRRGWQHQHRTERQLGSDRLGRLSGGKFIVPGIEEVSFEPPRGQKMTLVCDSRIEFIPKYGDSTEVVVVHNHTLTGGRWLSRRYLRKADRKNQPELAQKQIELCEAALRDVST
jgi:hypothetical protein